MGLFGVAGNVFTSGRAFYWRVSDGQLFLAMIFIMNIPLCMISFALVKMFVPNDKPEKQKYNKKFDIIGYSSIVIAMGCMQVVLDKGQQYNWFDTTWICWTTGVWLFAFVFFYVWELEYKYPVIDIRVFKDRNFMFGTLMSSFINVTIYSTLLLVPMFVQSLLGYSPSKSGLSMFPRAVVCLVCLLLFGEISRFIKPKIMATAGFLTISVSLLMLTQLNTTSSIESIILPNLFVMRWSPDGFCSDYGTVVPDSSCI